MGLFGKKYSLSGMSATDKTVLDLSLEVVLEQGFGNQFAGLQKAVKSDKLSKKNMNELAYFASWYKDLIVSQPQLAKAYGEANYQVIINSLGRIESFVKRTI